MVQTSKAIIFLFILFFLGSFSFASFPAPQGKKTGVTFDKALPEDISNENFPDRIESFDFPNANLFDLVKTISKFTGVNFIVDTTLKSKTISIIAPSPLTVAEAYKAFLSALAANGYTIVKSGAVWKIISVEKAHKENTEVYSGDYFPNTDQIITRIIKLKYINAEEFEKSIKWLLSGEGNRISSYESSNSIILSDYGSVIERIMKIVHEMDVPGSEEGIHILPIQYASAGELAGLLGELISINTRKKPSSVSRYKRKTSISFSTSLKTKGGGSLKISKIIPDERTNSLIVSANREGLSRVKSLLKRLDTPIDISRTGGVYVYNVLYGTAEEVYNTLMGIKPPKESNTKGFSPPSFPPRRSSYSPGGRSNSANSPLFENVTILADNNTNSLIISAKNRYDYERVEAVLKKIDVPRDQVFIQAIIVEMIAQNDDSKELNLGYSLQSLLGGIPIFENFLDSSFVGFLDQGFGLKSLQSAQLGPGLILSTSISKLLGEAFINSNLDNTSTGGIVDKLKNSGLPESVMQAAVNKSGPLGNNLNFEQFPVPLLRLLKKMSNVNVLSNPQLTTLDNVKAFIEVGEEAPVGLTNTVAPGTSVAQQAPERQNVTLKLEITPRINRESGTVQMDIKQKFDDFSNRESSASELASKSVHIIKRNIETKMVLNDGETAVLGGLLTDKEVKTENKVPILGDIPILGWLFKGSSTKKEKRNLLVFITPTIISGEQQKEKSREILGAKLEERINFIKKYMKGRDPHGKELKELIPYFKEIGNGNTDQQKRRKWFWQKDSKDQLPLKEELEKEVIEPSSGGESFIETDSEKTSPSEPEENWEKDKESFFEEEGDAESSSEEAGEEELNPEDFQPALPGEEDLKSEKETTNSREDSKERNGFEGETKSEDKVEQEFQEEDLDSLSEENSFGEDKESAEEKEGFIPIPHESLGL